MLDQLKGTPLTSCNKERGFGEDVQLMTKGNREIGGPLIHDLILFAYNLDTANYN